MKTLPTSSSSYSCGDIVVVPFPFSDRLAGKRRPALVISDAALEAAGIVWLVMITSARHSAAAFDCPILDPVRAGLKTACLVRPSKMATVEPFRIVRRAGRLGAKETNRVLETVRSFVAPAMAMPEGS